MHKNEFITMLSIIFLLFSVSCVHSLIRYDGPYEGKVIDADTGEPIEGVVVLGVWYRISGVGAGGASHVFHDAQETVTDKNGNFSLKGLGLKILSRVEPMNFLIFKAGYTYEEGPWISLKEGYIYKDTVKWEGKKPIIPLRKLTMEERKKRFTGKANIVPVTKQKLLIREVNKEYKEIGIPLYPEVE